MRALFATLSALASIPLLALGCADTDEELRATLRAERDRGLTMVTREEVERTPAGSPARAVMKLWRAIQYRDAQAGIASVSPSPPKRLVRAFENFFVDTGAAAFSAVKPRILDVSSGDRRAVVRVGFVRTTRLGKLLDTEIAGPARFEFVHADGTWKLRWRPALRELAGTSR